MFRKGVSVNTAAAFIAAVTEVNHWYMWAGRTNHSFSMPFAPYLSHGTKEKRAGRSTADGMHTSHCQ